MKIVASIADPELGTTAIAAGADLIELRLDLMDPDPLPQVKQCRKAVTSPLIATLRSASEGGTFTGTPVEWIRRIEPILPFVNYVDMEQKYASYASMVRSHDKIIIASCHSADMPPLFELFALERDLRTYGDIPKIIVTPRNEDDIITLISFTHAALKPVCTGVMGARFRSARAILPLFGSEFVYCHAGTPVAEGQYSVKEFVALKKLLTN